MTATASNTKTSDQGIKKANQLLADAQTAQRAADYAVSELAATKKVLAVAPQLVDQRRSELARAQEALRIAESQWTSSQEELSAKQTNAGQLIEVAAAAQQVLAKALVNGEDVGEFHDVPVPNTSAGSMGVDYNNVMASTTANLPPLNVPGSREPIQRQSYANAANAAYGISQPPAGSLTREYAPAPSDGLEKVTAYLSDRDVMCPSCGIQLRGIQHPECPQCHMAVTMPLLKSIRAKGA